MRDIQVLHIEDDSVFQNALVKILNRDDKSKFQITQVVSEDEAMRKLHQQKFDILLVDYYLKSGTGLNCIKRLREFDKVVPIVAISGLANPNIIGELLLCGADDYLNKEEMRPKLLKEVIERALSLGTARKQQIRVRKKSLKIKLAGLAKFYLMQLDSKFLSQVEEWSFNASESSLSDETLNKLYQEVCEEVSSNSLSLMKSRQTLRPLFLELSVRLAEKKSHKK